MQDIEPLPWLEQGGGSASDEIAWDTMAPWLRQVGGAVLLCVENAEEALHGKVSLVREGSSLTAS